MDQVDKYLNHITWLLNALKEHNAVINKDIKNKMKEKRYLINKSFQKFYYSFSLYTKLEINVEKGYKILLTSHKVNKKSMLTLKNVYLNRGKILLQDALLYLNNSCFELNINKNETSLINQEIKNIASLLNTLESDMNFLIINLI